MAPPNGVEIRGPARDRYSASSHASGFDCELLNSTRLEPPALEYPGPSGPGMGAVIHSFCNDAGKRFLNSAMFQGPEM